MKITESIGVSLESLYELRKNIINRKNSSLSTPLQGNMLDGENDGIDKAVECLDFLINKVV